MNATTLPVILVAMALSAAPALGGEAAGPAPRAAAAGAPPRVFVKDARAMADARRRMAAGDKDLAAAVQGLRREADAALRAGPFSVTDKKVAPPSGDKHDYMSQAPYWWPDPTKPDGKPYVRRDGEVHPDRGAFDNVPLGRMAGAVGRLAPAFYFTGHEPYAARAAELLRAWFLDPATRMNPNLNYGQSVPGRADGRGAGIIDTVCLVEVVDAAGLLAGSKAWTDADQKALQAWFAKYLEWLEESKVGREEAAARNNHRTWYDVQRAAFALFVGKPDAARAILAEARKQVDAQIEPDGREPLELARTKSWDYSVMNLGGFFDLATLGEQVGVDLWTYRSADGRSIRGALDYLLPYATGAEKWPHKQITGFRASRLAPLLRRAAIRFREKKYEDAAGGAGETDWPLALVWPKPQSLN